MSNTTHYDILKPNLPSDYRTILSKKCRVSKDLVYRVLIQKRSDKYGIIEKAYELATKTLKRRERLENSKNYLKSKTKKNANR